MHFCPMNMPLQRVSQGSMLHTVNADGLIESRLLAARTRDEERDAAAARDSLRGYFSFPSAVEADTTIFRHTLKSKLANPASNEVKKELLIEAGELLNLSGFAKAGTLHQHIRQFAFDLADQGATFTHKEGRFENWVHLMGHFYECKMFLECCMDAFRLLGGENLFARFNCGMSDKQVLWMMRCKSVHIANDFMLECLLPSMFTALIRECAADLQLPESQISESIVLEWAENSVGDLSFASNVYFLLNVLVPYAMMKAGIRTKYFQLYDADVHEDMTGALFGYMRAGLDRSADGGLNGDNAEGLDGKVEEDNKRQQRLITSNTEVGIIAAAYLVNITPHLRSKALELTSSKPQNTQERLLTNFSLDQAAFVEELLKEGCFRKRGAGPSQCPIYWFNRSGRQDCLQHQVRSVHVQEVHQHSSFCQSDMAVQTTFMNDIEDVWVCCTEERGRVEHPPARSARDIIMVDDAEDVVDNAVSDVAEVQDDNNDEEDAMEEIPTTCRSGRVSHKTDRFCETQHLARPQHAVKAVKEVAVEKEDEEVAVDEEHKEMVVMEEHEEMAVMEEMAVVEEVAVMEEMAVVEEVAVMEDIPTKCRSGRVSHKTDRFCETQHLVRPQHAVKAVKTKEDAVDIAEVLDIVEQGDVETVHVFFDLDVEVRHSAYVTLDGEDIGRAMWVKGERPAGTIVGEYVGNVEWASECVENAYTIELDALTVLNCVKFSDKAECVASMANDPVGLKHSITNQPPPLNCMIVQYIEHPGRVFIVARHTIKDKELFVDYGDKYGDRRRVL
ncbi:hypothetical protein B484DRAFT_465174 [Ochromonadaceae sp. CCMP2298]|nr:hypothetical protein B484DRAFT_465174 [Ochromonadaceae sp. CCMP2298]